MMVGPIVKLTVADDGGIRLNIFLVTRSCMELLYDKVVLYPHLLLLGHLLWRLVELKGSGLYVTETLVEARSIGNCLTHCLLW